MSSSRRGTDAARGARWRVAIGDRDAARILAGVESDPHAQARPTVGGPDEAHDGRQSTSGVPGQFIAICEKSRCSIVFDLLVPGGKWATVMARSVRFASRRSSHCREAQPGPHCSRLRIAVRRVTGLLVLRTKWVPTTCFTEELLYTSREPSCARKVRIHWGHVGSRFDE